MSTVVTELAGSGACVRFDLMRDVRDHPVRERAVVVNPHPGWAFLGNRPSDGIPPLSSTIVVDTRVAHADALVVVRTLDERVDRIVDEPGWQRLGDRDVTGDPAGATDPRVEKPFPPGTPLWRGPQESVGTVTFDPASVTGEAPGLPRPFEVRVNAWFAPAGTDCHIHRRHDFLEVHTQIHGYGRMQKFGAQDHATLYEDVLLSPGRTHRPFCVTGDDGGFVYPWHQYRADTDCVWLAVEYHELR